MLNAIITVTNLPKPFAGANTAITSPPTLLPFSNPACQAGIPGAAAAKAAPIMCQVICVMEGQRISELPMLVNSG